MFLIFLGVLVSPKIMNVGFGVGGGFKSQEIMEIGVLSFSNNEIWISLYESGAD